MKFFKKTKRDDTVARNCLILLIAIAALMRLYNIDMKGLWLDESATYFAASNTLASLVKVLPQYQPYPPLYFFIAHFALLLGKSEFFFRLPSVIFGVISIAVVYLAGKIFFEKATGLLAAFFMTLSPLHLHFSQEARCYTLFLLLSISGLIFFWKALYEDKLSMWAGFVVSTSLNLYTHYFSVFPLLTQCVFFFGIFIYKMLGKKALVPPKPVPQLLKFAISIAVCLCLFSPWIPHLLRHPGGGWFAAPSFTSDYFIGIINTFSVASYRSIYLFGAFFLLGAVSGLVSQRPQSLYLLIYFLAPMPLIALFLQYAKSYFSVKYVLFLLPVFLLFVSRGIIFCAKCVRDIPGVQSRVLKSPSALTVVLLTPFLLAHLYPLHQYYRDGYLRGMGRNDHWREIASFVSKNSLPGDAIGFYRDYIQSGFEFYYQGIMDHYLFTPYRKSYLTSGKRTKPLAYTLFTVPQCLNENQIRETFPIKHYQRLWMLFDYKFPVKGYTVIKQYFYEHGRVIMFRHFGRTELILFDLL